MKTIADSPFDLNNSKAYEAWREAKLEDYPTKLEDLVVPIADPFHITDTERNELVTRFAKTNMAIYVTTMGNNPDKNIPKTIMRQLGVTASDKNSEADEGGVTSLTPKDKEELISDVFEYIPYSSKRIQWHTDGYYNLPDKAIRSMILHCVNNADSGGENELLENEIMYILLRDRDPEFISALMEPDAMTIPAREENSVTLRPDMPGPVFSIHPDDGLLDMRYTHRVKSIVWKNTPKVQAAVEALREILAKPSPYKFRGKLQPGWGLICNNVLHTRDEFERSRDSASPRLLYRIRYCGRLPYQG